MRGFDRSSPIFTALFLFIAMLSPGIAQRKVLVIGDSLSREYQFEFQEFEDARNWVEILAEHRSGKLDFGELSELDIPGLGTLCDIFGGDLCDALGGGDRPLRRYRYNWAIPTYTAESYRGNLTGSGLVDQAIQGIIEPDFEEVDTVVIFLGGNDFDSVYESIYNGSSSAADRLVSDLGEDLEELVDYVREQDSGLEIVLVNVPHVGATPEVKGEYPTDPVKTARTTQALNRLSERLESFAAQRGIAYADVAAVTIDFLEPDTYCIGGAEFFNAGSDSGDAQFLWLGGELSQNFHPNTNGQALVANAIIDALNRRYSAGIQPLGQREILEAVIGLDADMPYADWIAAFGLGEGERGPNDDPEGDGIANLIEFALDLHPGQSDAARFPAPQRVGDMLTLTVRPRDLPCRYVQVIGQTSGDLRSWEELGDGTSNGDGTVTFTTSQPYLRIAVRVVVD